MSCDRCRRSHAYMRSFSLTSQHACVLVPFMSATVSNTLADRFAWWIECLFKALALHGHRRKIDPLLVLAIRHRMSALCKRLKSALAKWRDGTLGPPRKRAARERTAP